MKFDSTFDFLKALINNDGVLYDSEGSDFEFPKYVIEEKIYLIHKGNHVTSFEWSTTPPIQDKDLVECWSDKSICVRMLCFYNKKDNRTFDPLGKRYGLVFENYRKVENEPEWAKEARKKLED